MQFQPNAHDASIALLPKGSESTCRRVCVYHSDSPSDRWHLVAANTFTDRVVLPADGNFIAGSGKAEAATELAYPVPANQQSDAIGSTCRHPLTPPAFPKENSPNVSNKVPAPRR